MDDDEKIVSIPDLRQHAKAFAAQGDIAVARSMRDAADELSRLREKILKLKGTIREIRSIANLSINGRV